jgi:hypothetical protein
MLICLKTVLALGFLRRKKPDIRKMKPYLEPEARAYFQAILMETPTDENPIADEGE